jgi:hypothetical protein
MMEKHFPKNVIKNISELIEGELDLTAANGTRIAYSGWTEIEVRLISSKEEDPSVMVPFLVTNDSLEYPILGYNVIEEQSSRGIHLIFSQHILLKYKLVFKVLMRKCYSNWLD